MEDVQKEVVEHQRVATVRRIPNLAFEWKASYGNHRLVCPGTFELSQVAWFCFDTETTID